MTRKARAPNQKPAAATLRPMKLGGPAIVMLAAAAAIWPLWLNGPSCGDDFYFHFVSWSDAQRSILQGVLYPHWANSANFGVGEPRFVFYPPLTWMIGALLGLALPWKGVALAFTFLLLAATGLANRALAQEVLADGPSTLAGCAAICLGRSLSDITQRSAYAELTGGFWIPLLLLFLLRNKNPSGSFWQRTFDDSTVPLSLVMAGIWLSNGPLGIEANYLLAATAMVSATLQKSWAPLLRAMVSGSIGMALTSFYLIPAIWERNWANFQDAVTRPNYRIENSWLFGHHTDPTLMLHDRTLFGISVIAVAMLVVTLACALIAWRRGTLPGERRWWIPLALISIAVFFLQLPISLPLWNWLPELRFLQLPWRWLLVMQPSLAVFFAAAVWVRPSGRRAAILTSCALFFCIISTVTWVFCFNDCKAFNAGFKVWEAGEGAQGKPEYAPPDIQYRLLLPDVPRNCVVRNLNDLTDISGEPGDGLNPVRALSQSVCKGRFTEPMNQPERKGFQGVVDQSGYLILGLRSYPAWKAMVNGRPSTTLMERGHGLMEIPVARGPVTVVVQWTTTEDVIAGRWVTFFALVLLTGLYLVERRMVSHAAEKSLVP
jgi:hypothetical protein